MNKIIKIGMQLATTVIIFVIFYYVIEASISVKVILAYIVALGFSKALDRENMGTTDTDFLIQKERIDILEEEQERLRSKLSKYESNLWNYFFLKNIDTQDLKKN